MVNNQMFTDYIIDRFFLKSLEHENQKFPLFNVGQHKTDPNKFILQLAVAGYAAKDINISLEKNILTISSAEPSSTVDEETYSFSIVNIAKRKFMRRFTLFNDGITEISKAVVRDGILSIYVERFIPEEDRPRTIPVFDATTIVNELPNN